MLDCLHIENIAVIERADIQFGKGFHVLTGETGAGKSIIIDAINAVLGERVTRTMVRTGADTAHVTALFSDLSPWSVGRMESLGFSPDEDGNLLITRTISAEGKSSCTVNGRPATVALLREMGAVLIDLHGQHENQALLSPEQHLLYLDRFGNLEADVEQYTALYREWRQVYREVSAADMDESEKARRLDMLRYQLEEIEAAHITVGEQAELTARRDLYRNAEKVTDLLAKSRICLNGGERSDGALSLAEQALSALQSVARHIDSAEQTASTLQEGLYLLQEAAEELRSMTDLLDFDPRELDDVENRLDALRRLFAKYGADEQAVLDYGAQCRTQLEEIEFSDERLAALQQRERELHDKVTSAARMLTAKRCEAGKMFAAAVQEELSFLNMPGVTLVLHREDSPLSATGGDKVEFLLSANVGERPRPLARIASGGELSRVMLAIKSVLADADAIDTLIFDEIDTGISGRAAQKVGIKLQQTAQSTVKGRRRQVLCVTHLAQIAARGDHHYLIEKSVSGERTYTQVTHLDDEGRKREIARIIGGEVTPATLQAAEEMLT